MRQDDRLEHDPRFGEGGSYSSRCRRARALRGMTEAPPALLDEVGLARLLDLLRGDGFRIIGPRMRAGAIVLDDIASIADLPRGWGEEQDGGRYRLRRRDDDALFGFGPGPHAWKRFLHVPHQPLHRVRRDPDGVTIAPVPVQHESLALIGLRACDLQAIAIQDRVLLGGTHPDAHYAARRAGNLIIAVNCADPGGTCFCVSMGTGPGVTTGHDIALTELVDPGGLRFLARTGSPAGAALLARLPERAATAAEQEEAAAVTRRAAGAMGRSMAAEGVRDLLMANLDHPRWDEMAERCLTCGNCTMVCPTCFCTAVSDTTELADGATLRARDWASCFTQDFSFINGGPVRPSARARYRQWVTHKLATWHDQFDSSGCVGCGRCITWCPVGIDLTQDIAALRATAAG